MDEDKSAREKKIKISISIYESVLNEAKKRTFIPISRLLENLLVAWIYDTDKLNAKLDKMEANIPENFKKMIDRVQKQKEEATK